MADKKTDLTMSGYQTYTFRYQPVYPVSTPAIDKSELPRFESTEPVVGYRVWKLDRQNCQLTSCVYQTRWPFRQKMTRGVEKLNVGIHAAKTELAIHQGVRRSTYDIFPPEGLWSDYKADVAGEISMWGEVKECQYGYLSEFAYPKTLWMPESTDPVIVMQLEENYGVPVSLKPELGPWKQTIWDILTLPPPTFILPPRTSRTSFQYFGPGKDEKSE